MSASISHRLKSRFVAANAAHIEHLEGRRLLSASSQATDILGVTSDGGPTTFIAPQVASIVKIKGIYRGHYVGPNYGKRVVIFNVEHYTHTGHFSGVVTIFTAFDETPVAFTGVVHSNRHVSISFTAENFNGSFVGIASHTGGSFNGHFALTGGIVDQGTFNAGKT